MLKILQAKHQQYMHHELADVQAGLRKGRGTRPKWIMKTNHQHGLNSYCALNDFGIFSASHKLFLILAATPALVGMALCDSFCSCITKEQPFSMIIYRPVVWTEQSRVLCSGLTRLKQKCFQGLCARLRLRALFQAHSGC